MTTRVVSVPAAEVAPGRTVTVDGRPTWCCTCCRGCTAGGARLA